MSAWLPAARQGRTSLTIFLAGLRLASVAGAFGLEFHAGQVLRTSLTWAGWMTRAPPNLRL